MNDNVVDLTEILLKKKQDTFVAALTSFLEQIDLLHSVENRTFCYLTSKALTNYLEKDNLLSSLFLDIDIVANEQNPDNEPYELAICSSVGTIKDNHTKSVPFLKIKDNLCSDRLKQSYKIENSAVLADLEEMFLVGFETNTPYFTTMYLGVYESILSHPSCSLTNLITERDDTDVITMLTFDMLTDNQLCTITFIPSTLYEDRKLLLSTEEV